MMTKGRIYRWHNRIQAWAKQDDFLYHCNAQKIKQFYDDFQPRLETLYQEINSLERQYFVHEEDKLKTEGGVGVLLEGKTQADFDKDWAELMNQQVAERLKLIKA